MSIVDACSALFAYYPFKHWSSVFSKQVLGDAAISVHSALHTVFGASLSVVMATSDFSAAADWMDITNPVMGIIAIGLVAVVAELIRYKSRVGPTANATLDYSSRNYYLSICLPDRCASNNRQKRNIYSA